MNTAIAELIAQIDANQTSMTQQLIEFCAINTGTTHLAGIADMATMLQSAFTPLADIIEKQPLPPAKTIDMNGALVEQQVGDILYIRKRPSLPKRLLLCGHMDTVYSPMSLFQTSKFINDNTLNGPGVADMKGGIVVMLNALKTFEQLDIAKDLGWDILINSDEEIGSPASCDYLNQIAKQYQAALVYEPSIDPQGTLAKNRKGSGKITIIASGKAAHAGRAFHNGRNAIAYLAEAIVAIHALNTQQDGITINVGKITGGDALNMVPAHAAAQLDIRITHSQDEAIVLAQLNAILQQLQRQDYQLTLHGGFGRPVKRVDGPTTLLFHRIQKLGESLGLQLTWQDSGGCCDGNNIAQHHIPVIDTLGVRGGNIHSSDEYVLLDSLAERTALTLLILQDIATNAFKE